MYSFLTTAKLHFLFDMGKYLDKYLAFGKKNCLFDS